MADHQQSAGATTLAEARETLAQQAAEIERLRRQVSDQRLVREIMSAVTQASVAAFTSTTVSHVGLLEMVVATAAQVIRADAASLFLIDHQTEELIFEVALGQKAEEVKKLRVPLGHGIAGLVAVTGQPMTIADADRDHRHAADIAQRIGYVPRSILCVPLHYGDQVIGVLELLDKRGISAFTDEDMATLGLFANQAAVAIELSRTRGSLAALAVEAFSSFGQLPPGEVAALQDRARRLAASVEAEPSYLRALALARLVSTIADRGEQERVACQTILEGFSQYLQSRPNLSDEIWSLS